MKLMSAYSVAVYSAQACTFYDSNKAVSSEDLSSLNNDPPPDSQQLNTIQQSLTIHSESHFSRIIILVPDTWLSVSQHKVDHLIPSSLQPLAALSYAVETIFSPPDTLMFSYQYDVLLAQQSQLTVFACSSEWAEQLCLPFQSIGNACLLMPLGQWVEIQSRARSWSSCAQRALSVYQPEKQKHLKARRLCWYLVFFSLLVHSVASVYFFSLHHQSAQTLMARQKIQATQSTWSTAHNSNEFSQSVLSLVQALPRSARLEYFESEDKRSFLQMTLPVQDLNLLLVEWYRQNPDWQWEVEQQPYYLSSPMSQKEVVDVSIEVFEK